MTNREELALVNDALTRLYAGTRIVRLGDRTYGEADIMVLTKRRDDLKWRVFREEKGHSGAGRGVPVERRGRYR